MIAVDQITVQVYDSMFRCIESCVSMQSASMLQSAEDHINFRIKGAQIQEGGADCGLFAIAFTIEFCNPECYRWSYRIWLPIFFIYNRCDRNKMREHFLRCLENGKMSPFLPKWWEAEASTNQKSSTALWLSSARGRWRTNGILWRLQAVVSPELSTNSRCCFFYPGHKQGWFRSHCL